MEFDLAHVGVTVVGVVLTVGILKNDLKWIREWMKEHKEEHKTRDAAIDARVRKLEIGHE
jgi:hypothetical protein